MSAHRKNLEWIGCWAAYWLVLWLPIHSRLWWRLLPHAGTYAHTPNLAEYIEFGPGGNLNVQHCGPEHKGINP